MLLTLLSWITGIAPALINIAGRLTDLAEAKIRAKTDVEKAIIAEQIEAVHDKRAVLVADVGSRIATILDVGTRTAFALLALIYVAKILVWDKVIGAFYGCTGHITCHLFQTDPIDNNMWWIILGIIGFYFVISFNRK